MSHKFHFLCSAFFLLFLIGCSQKTKKSSLNKTIDSFITTYHSKGQFNGSVLVMKNKKEVYHQSFGFSDGSKETKLSNDFRYGIGSIYKEFPAVAIMQLQEKQLINLEDKIQKHLPELPEWAAQISIKNLLQYTSGLPRIDFNKYFGKNIPLTDQGIWNDILNLEKLTFEAGTDYLYSNNNPFLLIKIIEKISGNNFEDHIKKEILLPFNLKHTILKKEYPFDDKVLMAMPFNEDFKEDGYQVKAPTMLFTSTTKDLYHWFFNLNSLQIINQESLNIIAKTARLKNDNMQAPLGNCIIKDDVIIEHLHHGSMGNYEALVQRYNTEDITIILLTNQKNGNVFDLAASIYTMVK